MTQTDKVDIIYIIAQDDDEVRPHYSGRGMFGDACYSIVTDEPENVIERASAEGLTGARTDSMGLKTIVYWPHVKGELMKGED